MQSVINNLLANSNETGTQVKNLLGNNSKNETGTQVKNGLVTPRTSPEVEEGRVAAD